LNTVWFNNGVFFEFRGRQEQSTLLLGDLEIKKNANGLEFVEFNGKILYWYLWLRKDKVELTLTQNRNIHKTKIKQRNSAVIAVLHLESSKQLDLKL